MRHLLSDVLNLSRMDGRRESETSPRSGSSSERADEQTSKKRRHRRGKHKRRWKPYSKMTLEERQKAESREAARAARRERELVGKPAAPWNTTQFIMEEHSCEEMNFVPQMSRTISVGSSVSEEEYYESPEESAAESGVFWNRDFETVCQQMEIEQLSELSKTELVRQCLQLREEEKSWQQSKEEVEELERRLASLKEENRRLKEENLSLQQSAVGQE